MKENIDIIDFNMFCDIVKSITKFTKSAKFQVSKTGLAIYGRNEFARCEITSNAISSKNDVSFCFEDVSSFYKILGTMKEVHEGDFSSLKFVVEDNSIKFNSKKFKTKLILQAEEKIAQCISQKLTTPLKSIFEFTTTSDMIRRLNNHSFIFSDPSNIRIYLGMQSDLEANALYATIGNNNNNMNNSLTLKFGLVTFGKLDDRQLIIDMDRLNVFNVIPSNNITIQLMDKNVLVSKVNIKEKTGSFCDIIIYNSLRKN